ncbi:GPI-GlcNAc transferase complex, PIG-H component-domain-containing protein [Paraphoma chrysanthemicola]|uniref:GPI-GlcNAc transferase complex, PIG-H component-domain-containing protein n=1 Tax=Paraphoma chrysanthemicola TaxID=798071 RepID=A0A8K0W2X3_9PLEO|nr:GPI-GlcNAc transferase complex, PIG-H component-domain-containing protein [Paraphoma chrysanthemicola]
MRMRALLQRLTAPPAQHLRVLEPTPSTICFTVSTRELPATLPARLAQYIGVFLRTFAVLSATFVLLLKWRLTLPEKIPRLLARLLDPLNDWELLHAVEIWPWQYILPSACLVIYLALRRPYTEESLLILRNLGIQTSTSSPTYLQSATTRFLPSTSIQDIVIHEAFKGFEVRFYLGVVVKEEDKVVVVFPKMMPRREVLEVVWRGAKRGLWGTKEGRGNKGSKVDEKGTVKP